MTYNERWTTLVILVWTAAWYAVWMGDGQPGWRGLSWLAAVPMLVASVVVVVWALATSLYGTVVRLRTQAPLWRGAIPVATLLVGVPLACNAPLPASHEAGAFRAHRNAFVAAAEAAVGELDETGAMGVRLPDSPLYDSGVAGHSPGGDTTNHVEFVLTDFGRPVVFIASDDPEDVHDTCSAGGYPVEKLEPQWYVCNRDWN